MLVGWARLFVVCASLVGGVTMHREVHSILRELSNTWRHHIGDEQCNDLNNSGQRLATVASSDLSDNPDRRAPPIGPTYALALDPVERKCHLEIEHRGTAEIAAS